MTLRIACAGEAMIELSVKSETAATLGVAGDTLNTAIYLRRAAPQCEVDYITCLGDDPFSDRIRHFIADQGIGTGGITTLPGRSPGLYAITTSDEGERSFTYWRSSSAAREMFQYGQEPDFSALEGYDLVYLSGISMAILPHKVRLSLLDWLVQSDVKFAYDSNYRPRLWENPATARAVNSMLWARADIGLPSLDDEMALFDQSADEVADRFKALRLTGALKRGAGGPLSLGEAIDQTYAPAPKVIDTTAAGDSFNGGYLAALLTGADQAGALMAGHTCAAKVVQYPGAIIPEDAP